MKVACPKCGCAMGLSEKVCPNPKCRFVLTLWSALRHFWERLRSKAKSVAATECPTCRARVPLNSSSCPACGASITFSAAYEATVGPVRRRWHSFLETAPPGVKRFVQRIYLILSIAALWWLLGYVERNFDESWFAYAGLSVVYLVAIAVVARGIADREVFILFPQKISRITKLALIFNYLTLLLALQLFIGAWLLRTTMLATLFGVTVLASWIARTFCSEFWQNLGSFLAPQEPAPARKHFDPTRKQGRRAEYD